MKLQILWRSTLAIAVGMTVLVAPPARAVDLKDFGIDLGDLGKIFGGKGKLDAFSLAESVLQRELPNRVGPADEYEVKFDRSGSNIAKGIISRVDVAGINVRTSDGLVIPELDLHLEDVKLGLKSRGIDKVGKSDFSVGLGEAAVSNYVRHRGGARLKDVTVAFQKGQIMVGGTPELLGFPVRTQVAGKPVIRGGTAIDFDASRVDVGGIKLPGMVVDALEKKVNPVVDLSGLKLPVRISDFRVEGSRLVASGAATFGRK